MIVAVDANMAIGNNGDQLIYISDDLKHFKATTQEHTVIMGRKTCEALPKGYLPNRRNIVVTRSAQWRGENVETAHSPEEALQMCSADGEAFVIGGGELYRACLPLASKLYVTHIKHGFGSADTHFPAINSNEWQLTSQSDTYTDPKSGIEYFFAEYERIAATE